MTVLFQKHPQLSLYSKNEQHDSQEFLHTFIDILNEDLKRNRNENHKNKEKIVNGLSWMGYWAGNSSSISDLFFGVLKNTVKCPECQIISNNFEPFLNLSLPFPGNNPKTSGNIAYFKENSEEDPKIQNFELNLLDLPPDVFKEKISNNRLNNKAFVFLHQYAASLAYEPEIKTVKEIIAENKPAILGIFESNEKLRQDEGVYSLVFSKNEGNAEIFNFLDVFRLIKLNRKGGSSVISQVINNYFTKMLSNLGIFGFNAKKYSLKLRLFDKKSNIAICENCEQLDHCSCNFEFPSFNPIETKYRFSDYTIFFEICLDWDSMSQAEQDSFLLLSENSQDFQKLLFGTGNKSSSKSKDSFTIYDFLKNFRDPEVLCSQNAWFCNKCKKNQRATTQMEVFSAPKILIIHLKRFKNNRNIKTKINLKIIYPLENLDLKEYVVESLMPEELVERKLRGEEKYEKKSMVYDLYGVINHHGSNLSCGHYTAICKNIVDKKWYKFDDKLVYEVGQGAVCNNDAYVLFYRRRGN